MSFVLAALLTLTTATPVPGQQQGDGAGFVTTLGRDTIALESYKRTASRMDGAILLRTPQTVRFHYVLTLRPDGTVARSVVEMTPVGVDNAPRNHTSITFTGDSARIEVDTAGVQQSTTRAVPRGTMPELMTGFGSDYGIYIAFGLYEPMLAHLTAKVNDTVRVPVLAAVGGRAGTKFLVRRSSTMVDVDYFKILWTHLTVNGAGLIQGADATETTEKTRSIRTPMINMDSAAKEFLKRDRAGKALGVSSPADSVRAHLGSAAITIDYSSPRKRGRDILGATIPFGHVWRTGANAATAFTVNRAITIGGTSLKAGSYTLWTVPRADGADLVINAQTGQWGTDYDPARDVMRLPLKVARGQPVQENFTITVTGTGTDGQLRFRWDDFAWSIPIVAH